MKIADSLYKVSAIEIRNKKIRYGKLRLANKAVALFEKVGDGGCKNPFQKMLKKQLADLHIPDVPDFLDQIVASGGHLWACRLSADMNKVTELDLRDDVEGIISASDFIEITANAQLLFI